MASAPKTIQIEVESLRRDDRPLAEKYGHLAALIAQAEFFLGEGDYEDAQQCLLGCRNIILGYSAGLYCSRTAAPVAPAVRSDLFVTDCVSRLSKDGKSFSISVATEDGASRPSGAPNRGSARAKAKAKVARMFASAFNASPAT